MAKENKTTIILATMSPEARDLLNDLCRKYKDEFNDGISSINGYQALYWAVRYSGLIFAAPVSRFERWHALWARLKLKRKQTDREWRILRVVAQLGDAAKAVAYGEYYKRQGYQEELKKALADALATTYMAALNEGFDLAELEKLGQDELEHAINKRLPK